MKIRSFSFVVILFLGLSSHVTFAFDKKDFYKTLASGSLGDIENQIVIADKLSLPEKEAYAGALLMKKAGLLKDKKKQLKLFKEGKTKLEHAITNNSGNCEFRLLRLIIQENAPQVLGYNKQINEDSTFITAKFNTLSPLLQVIARDYGKHSKNLKLPAD